MKTKNLFATLLTLALFTAGHAQTLDKARLDQFFLTGSPKRIRLWGSLTIAKAGNVLYTAPSATAEINGTEKKPLTAVSRYRIGSITKMFTAAMTNRNK